MQKRMILNGTRVAAPLALAIGLLLTGSPAAADDTARVCSNSILQGNYGFTVQGTLAIPGATLQNGAGLPMRGVVMTRFDGNGNLTQVDHIVVNGMPPPVEWTPGSGTYTINADCTGTAVINSPANPAGPLKVHLVVTGGGKEVQQVVDTNAVTALGIRVE